MKCSIGEKFAKTHAVCRTSKVVAREVPKIPSNPEGTFLAFRDSPSSPFGGKPCFLHASSFSSGKPCFAHSSSSSSFGGKPRSSRKSSSGSARICSRLSTVFVPRQAVAPRPAFRAGAPERQVVRLDHIRTAHAAAASHTFFLLLYNKNPGERPGLFTRCCVRLTAYT